MPDNSVVGQIALELNLDTNTLRRQLRNLDDTSNNAASRMTSSFGSAFKKIAAGAVAAFSVSAIINFGKEAVEAAASVKAVNSQLEQTFGYLQSNAEEAIKSVADESGILETRLQGVGTSIYAFAKTTGMDSASALNMMKEALQVTADSAAYYDSSLEDTAESLKSFLKGNYENDAALGLSCTETTRNAAANKLYGKSFQELSEAQKQLTLLQMVKDANALSGAMGQASREADGWENVIGNLKEAWKQFIATIGQPILQAAVTVIKQITSAIQMLTQYAEMASNALGELFGWGNNNSVSASVSSAANSANALSVSTADSANNIKATEKEAKKLQKALVGFDQLNILSSENDTDASIDTDMKSTAVALDTSPAQSSTESLIDSIQKKLQSFFNNSGLEDFVSEIQKCVSEIDFVAIGENFKSIMQSLQPIAQAEFKGVQKIAKSSMKTLGKTIGGVSKIVGKSVQTISGGIAKWLEEDKDKIVDFINTMSTNISNGIDNIGNFIDTMTDTVGESIDRMRPTMENAISTMLSGITAFSGSIGVIISKAFNTASGVIAKWAEDNKGTIGEFTDNIQSMFAETMTFIGNTFSETGDIMLSWWNGGGQELWEKFIGFVTDLGTVFMDVFNNGIKPAWDTFVGILQSAWDNCIAPVFEQVMSVVTKVGDMLMALWNNILKPVVDWLIDVLAPWWQTVFNDIQSVCDTVFTMIGDVVNGFLEQLGGLMEFLEGVFSGDWEKMWNGLQEIAQGTWDAIWGTIKGIINLIIDGINTIWSGIYFFAKGIVDTIGGISGAIGDLFGQDWSFSMPAEPPLIPKLAKGGLVTAPTLALVGDNKNAQSDPEVVAPLSKLKSMLPKSEAESTTSNEQVIRLLQRICDLLNGEEMQLINNVYLDSDVIERKLVKVRKRKSRRYGGATT